jgi:hypothetical protein
MQFQNVENNYSTTKTRGVTLNQMLEVKITKFSETVDAKEYNRTWLSLLKPDLVMLLLEVGRKEQLLIGSDGAHRAVNLLPVKYVLKSCCIRLVR